MQEFEKERQEKVNKESEMALAANHGYATGMPPPAQPYNGIHPKNAEIF